MKMSQLVVWVFFGEKKIGWDISIDVLQASRPNFGGRLVLFSSIKTSEVDNLIVV